MIAYSLSTFLQLQTQIKGPVQQSLNATSQSSSEFQAALSGDGGFLQPAGQAGAEPAGAWGALLSIETFPPYFPNAPALFQATVTNPGGRMMRVELLGLEVLHGNGTIPPEPAEFEHMDVAYKKEKSSYFTPQEAGNYTLRARIIQNATTIKTAEKTILVQHSPNQRTPATFSGTADFSANTTTEELFYYELKNRRFPATGSGREWKAKIPQNHTTTAFSFLNFTRNANVGAGSQFFESGGAYFRTAEEEGHDALLTPEPTEISANAAASYLAILSASACNATLILRYETGDETKTIAVGEGTCPIDQQCTNGRQMGAALKRISCGQTAGKYLHAARIKLREEKLEAFRILPGCAMHIAAITLVKTSDQEYNQPSAAHLIVQNSTLLYINGKQYPYEEAENLNSAFRRIDVTTEARAGVREFNISSDTQLKFVPYLLYTEDMNHTELKPNLSASASDYKLTLIPELEARSSDISRHFQYGSSAGSCYSETGLWGFGAELSETPDIAIGTLRLRLEATFEWPSNPPPTTKATLRAAGHQISLAASQAEVSSGKAFVSLEGYNTPADDAAAVYGEMSHSDTNPAINYAYDANLKTFFGSVEATDLYYPLSGISETTGTTTLPEGLLGLYLIEEAAPPSIRHPYGAAGFYARTELLGETHSARGYRELLNGWNPQGYQKMTITDEASFADLSAKALPNQQIHIRTRTETDTPTSIEAASASVHLIAVKKRPMRAKISAGNQTIHISALNMTEVPLENATGIIPSFEGTGKIRGKLTFSATKDNRAEIPAPSFGRAQLLLEPSGRIENLEIIINGRAARHYAELSNIDKADLSPFIVPELRNTIEFRGKGGTLKWKLIFE